MKTSLHIVACGGTFDKIYLPNEGQLGFGSSVVERLLQQAKFPEDISVSHPMTIDSLEMTDKHRESLAQHILELPCQHVIVVHGTDTMVASARHIAMSNPNKTILLTGAMVPARLPHSDAQMNLGYAMGKIHALNTGVWLAMNGTVFSHDDCTKNKSLGRFEKLIPKASL